MSSIKASITDTSAGLFTGLPGYENQSYMLPATLASASATQVVYAKPNSDAVATISGTGLTVATKTGPAGQPVDVLTGGTIASIDVRYNFTRQAPHALSIAEGWSQERSTPEMARFATPAALEPAGRMTFPYGASAADLGAAHLAAAAQNVTGPLTAWL